MAKTKTTIETGEAKTIEQGLTPFAFIAGTKKVVILATTAEEAKLEYKKQVDALK